MTLIQFLDERAKRREARFNRLIEANRPTTLLDRFPGWPVINERQIVTVALFALAGAMLLMARENPKLWDVKLFEVIFQAVVLTGLLNMVAAFHFASNKGSETSRENTGKAFDAITATATGQPPPPTSEPDITLQPGDKVNVGAENSDA